MPQVEEPTLVRLEYLTPKGWSVGHAGIALLHPDKYVERLAARGKFGRAIALNEKLQPQGQVWEPKSLPDPSELVPSTTVIPQLRSSLPDCPLCDEKHAGPFDGSCLL